MSDAGKPDSCKVFLHNLPYGYEKRDFEDLFSKYKLSAYVELEIMRRRDGSSKGMAAATLATQDDVEDAIKELNEVEVDGRKITCREDRGSGYVHPASMEKSAERRDKGKGKGKGWGKSSKGWGKRDRYDDWGYGGKRGDDWGGGRGRRSDSRGRGGGGGRGRDRDDRDRRDDRRDDRDRSRGRDRRRSRSR